MFLCDTHPGRTCTTTISGATTSKVRGTLTWRIKQPQTGPPASTRGTSSGLAPRACGLCKRRNRKLNASHFGYTVVLYHWCCASMVHHPCHQRLRASPAVGCHRYTCGVRAERWFGDAYLRSYISRPYGAGSSIRDAEHLVFLDE